MALQIQQNTPSKGVDPIFAAAMAATVAPTARFLEQEGQPDVVYPVGIREVLLHHDRFLMAATEMLKRVDENPIFVVPAVSITDSGNFELVEPLPIALDDLQQLTGLDIDIHVDGASGAFLAPFRAPDVKFDLRRVKSISTSGHRFGLAPLGSGLPSTFPLRKRPVVLTLPDVVFDPFCKWQRLRCSVALL